MTSGRGAVDLAFNTVGLSDARHWHHWDLEEKVGAD